MIINFLIQVILSKSNISIAIHIFCTLGHCYVFSSAILLLFISLVKVSNFFHLAIWGPSDHLGHFYN